MTAKFFKSVLAVCVLFSLGWARPVPVEEPGQAPAEETAEAGEAPADPAATFQKLRLGLEGLARQIAVVNSRLEESEREQTDLAAQLVQAQAEIANGAQLAARVAELEREVADLRGARGQLAQQLEQSESERRALEEELESTRERLGTVEEKRRAATADLEGTLAENEVLSERVDELVGENQSLKEFFELVRQQALPEGGDGEPAGAVALETAGTSAEEAPSAGEPSQSASSAGARPPEIDRVEPGRSLLAVVEDWAAAWSGQRADDYLGFYARSFQPPGDLSRPEWEGRRRERLAAPEWIEVKVAILDVRAETDRGEVELMQSYASGRFSDTVIKTLALVREDGLWKIERETVR